ncbi:MAG: NUDIX domain-containing protein [Firmicutes bacterium]|nr:NUDIX domain-containing protein [Bacillota bacterium]
MKNDNFYIPPIQNDVDMTFDIDCGRFNYRVGAIIIDNGCVLMAKNKSVRYFYSVGGRVRFGETSSQAVVREAFEETGIMFEIDRLGFVYENFSFMQYRGKHFHGISFYYYLKNPSSWTDLKLAFYDKDANDHESDHILKWIPLDKIKSYNLVPEFFKTELIKPSQSIMHIVETGEM